MTNSATETGRGFETKEILSETGFLLVITGPSGTGKDTVTNEVLKHPAIIGLKFKRLVTCADRAPRPGEVHGIDYYFVTPKELDEMSAKGELVEKPQPTGTSRKGTPKREFRAILSGEKRLWRIESYLASKVASGSFFDEQFESGEAKILRQLTKVICITSPIDQIEGRRKARDRKNYNPKEYELRDVQDEPNLRILRESAVFVDNLDGQLEQAVNEVVNQTLKHHEKIKNKK